MKVSTRWWLIVGALFIVACAIGVVIAPDSNTGFKDAAAVIAFATMLAVGIERAFEIAWTLVDQAQKFGAYWPMSVIGPQIKAIEDQTQSVFDNVMGPAKAALEQAKTAAAGDQVKLAGLDAAMARIQAADDLARTRFAAAQALAPGSTRIANVVGATDSVTSEITNALQDAGAMTADISNALDLVGLRAGNALDIISTFNDNPARRLTSLVLGAAVGALVAGFVGVNLFAAIVGGSAALLGGKLGVLVTGVVVGLGSGPTHELVKGLQSVKKSGQQVGVGGGSADGGAAGFAPDAMAAGIGRRRVMIRATE